MNDVSEQLWWYVARSSGIVSWCLLAASVGLGITMSLRAAARRRGIRPSPTSSRLRANWLLDLHRFLGGVATIFVGVHVGAIVADSYVHFGPTDVLVPLASSWHPVAVAAGIVAMYLLLAVELTSLARNRLTRNPSTRWVWRFVHGASFPLFVLATLHGISAGTDASALWLRTAMLLSAAIVTVLCAVRILQGRYATAVPTRRPTRAVTPQDTSVRAT